MRPTPYVASLRVYEPLNSFEPAEQVRWNAIDIKSTTGIDEQARAIRRTITIEPPVLAVDGAHILEFEGRRYVAPWTTATRCNIALGDFQASMPSSVAKFFVPQNVVESITINAEEMEDKVPYIITETWMIPPRWFGLFEPDERLRGETVDGPFTVMRTSIATAKRRCMFTHQSVVSAFGNGPIEQEIADLLEWLNIFHPESIVECDYGGLAGYLEKILINDGLGGLEADTSIEDIQLSLSGLASGDGAKAGEGYERLVSRWRKVAAMEQAS